MAGSGQLGHSVGTRRLAVASQTAWHCVADCLVQHRSLPGALSQTAWCSILFHAGLEPAEGDDLIPGPNLDGEGTEDSVGVAPHTG